MSEAKLFGELLESFRAEPAAVAIATAGTIGRKLDERLWDRLREGANYVDCASVYAGITDVQYCPVERAFLGFLENHLDEFGTQLSAQTGLTATVIGPGTVHGIRRENWQNAVALFLGV